MNLKKYTWGCAKWLVLYFVFSCSVEKSPVDSNQLRIQISNEIDILNPALSRLSVSTIVENQMMLPLARWDDDSQNWVPVLAQSYQPNLLDTGASYALRMRPEARWSDGTPISHTDVAYTIKMGLNPYISHQSWASYLGLISEMSIVQDTLMLTLETPYILADEFIASLTPYPAHVLDSAGHLEAIPLESFHTGEFTPEEDQKLRALADRFNNWGSPRQWPKPVSGLYRVSSWNPGQEVSLSRIDSFWAHQVDQIAPFYSTNLDTIRFVVIPDPQNALHAFTSGAVDVLNTVEESDTAFIHGFAGAVHEISTLQMYYISVNNTHPLLSQADIRRALNLAINRQDMIGRLFTGRGQPAYGPIHPSKSYYESFEIPFAPEEARRILEGLECQDVDGDGILECPVDGVDMKLTFQIWTTRSHLSRNVATLLKGYWNDIGVDLDIQSADFRTFLPELQNRTYEMAALALRQNNLLDDPYPLWHSDQAEASGKNYQGLAHDSIDVVLESLRTAIKPEIQSLYYAKLQKWFADLVPVFFLVAPDELVVVRHGVDLYWSSQRPGYDLLRSRIER